MLSSTLSLFLTIQLLASCISVQAFCGNHVHGLEARHVGKRAAGQPYTPPSFTYDGSSGPVLWHKLNANNTACGSGTRQSPIALQTGSTKTVAWGDVILDIAPQSDLVLQNLGLTVEVTLDGSLYTAGDARVFKLKQFHFHSPSEHHINGRYFDAEVHFVFQQINTDQTNLKVVGFPIEASSLISTRFLEKTLQYLDDIPEGGDSTIIPKLDFSSFITKYQAFDFYTYGGSLTTPPCSEVVTWYVANQAIPLDTRTFSKLKRITGFSSRFIQSAPGSPNVLQAAQTVRD